MHYLHPVGIIKIDSKSTFCKIQCNNLIPSHNPFHESLLDIVPFDVLIWMPHSTMDLNIRASSFCDFIGESMIK